MGIIEKIMVSDETMARLQEAAAAHGRTVEQEVALLVEGEVKRPTREELLARSRALRASMPPQTTDSLALLREDRDR
jgi:plasmid stability protein